MVQPCCTIWHICLLWISPMVRWGPRREASWLAEVIHDCMPIQLGRTSLSAHCIECSSRGGAHKKTTTKNTATNLKKQRAASFHSGHHFWLIALSCWCVCRFSIWHLLVCGVYLPCFFSIIAQWDGTPTFLACIFLGLSQHALLLCFAHTRHASMKSLIVRNSKAWDYQLQVQHTYSIKGRVPRFSKVFSWNSFALVKESLQFHHYLFFQLVGTRYCYKMKT